MKRKRDSPPGTLRAKPPPPFRPVTPKAGVSPKTRHTPQEKGGPKAALFTNQTNFVFRIGRSRTRFPVAAKIAFAIDGGTSGEPGDSS